MFLSFDFVNYKILVIKKFKIKFSDQNPQKSVYNIAGKV